MESVRNYIVNAQLLHSEYSRTLNADKLALLEDFLGGFEGKSKLKNTYRLLFIRTRRHRILDDLVWRVFTILVSLSNMPD
jgi:hypothetical protein